MPIEQGYSLYQIQQIAGVDFYTNVVRTKAAAGQVVLVHGFTLDHNMWAGQFYKLMRAGFDVLRYDMRGHGRSSSFTEGVPYSPAGDLKAVMNSVGFEKAHIIGLSRGGAVAIDMVLEYPDAVKSLVVIDSGLSGFDYPHGYKESTAQIAEAAKEHGVGLARDLWLQHPLFDSIRSREGFNRRLVEIVAGYPGDHWVKKDPAQSSNPPAAKRLGEIQVPTLVLVGEQDLPDFRAIADLLGATIPNARKVILKGVGHMSAMEAPDQVNAAILQFLDPFAL